MPAVAAIGVDDNFPSGEAAVGVWATVDETSRSDSPEYVVFCHPKTPGGMIAFHDFSQRDGLFDRVIRPRQDRAGLRSGPYRHESGLPSWYSTVTCDLLSGRRKGNSPLFRISAISWTSLVGRINGKRHIRLWFSSQAKPNIMPWSPAPCSLWRPDPLGSTP